MDKELQEECLQVVDKLNEYVWSILGEESIHGFSYNTDGFVQQILFDEQILWDSENEPREWVEINSDYESLEKFIKSMFNEYVRDLYKLKFVNI